MPVPMPVTKPQVTAPCGRLSPVSRAHKISIARAIENVWARDTGQKPPFWRLAVCFTGTGNNRHPSVTNVSTKSKGASGCKGRGSAESSTKGSLCVLGVPGRGRARGGGARMAHMARLPPPPAHLPQKGQTQKNLSESGCTWLQNNGIGFENTKHQKY